MTKRRLPTIILSSPIILVVLIGMVITACVGYALNGKWELKTMVNEWKG